MSEKCLGDLGECAHNGSCMYGCGGKPQSEADERRDEAAEIIGDMIENIKLDGLYSKESTLTFLTQVYFCLKPANPPSEDAQAPVAQGVSKSSVVALLKRIRQWDALDIPSSDGPYWKREIDAVLSGVSEPVEQPAAYRADWPNWRQYHDETDPLPRKWDGEVPTITPLFTHSKKGGDAARALTDEQITEIASGYADGISDNKGFDWGLAFNACAFGLSRRNFSGDAVREALKIAQVLLKSYGVSHAEIDAALRIGGSGAGGAT